MYWISTLFFPRSWCLICSKSFLEDRDANALGPKACWLETNWKVYLCPQGGVVEGMQQLIWRCPSLRYGPRLIFLWTQRRVPLSAVLTLATHMASFRMAICPEARWRFCFWFYLLDPKSPNIFSSPVSPQTPLTFPVFPHLKAFRRATDPLSARWRRLLGYLKLHVWLL